MPGELKRDTPRKKLFPVTRTPQNTLGTWHCGAATKSKYPGGVQVSRWGWSEAEPPEESPLFRAPEGRRVVCYTKQEMKLLFFFRPIRGGRNCGI
jgi:hypothetical protein